MSRLGGAHLPPRQARKYHVAKRTRAMVPRCARQRRGAECGANQPLIQMIGSTVATLGASPVSWAASTTWWTVDHGRRGFGRLVQRPHLKLIRELLNEKQGFAPAVILTEEPLIISGSVRGTRPEGRAISRGSDRTEPRSRTSRCPGPSAGRDGPKRRDLLSASSHSTPPSTMCSTFNAIWSPTERPPLSSRGDEAVAFSLPKVSTRCRARVLGFPGGLPSDVGLFLTWAG